jgi:hypothetical protein
VSVRARARESPQSADDVPGLEEHRRHEHGARALVDGLGQALGQRVRRQRREADDLEPGLGASSWRRSVWNSPSVLTRRGRPRRSSAGASG